MRIAPTMQLITIIVQTSIKQQAKRYCFFEASTQASEALSQALIELHGVRGLVCDHLLGSQQTFVVLLYADFLRELVFFFLIA